MPGFPGSRVKIEPAVFSLLVVDEQVVVPVSVPVMNVNAIRAVVFWVRMHGVATPSVRSCFTAVNLPVLFLGFSL